MDVALLVALYRQELLPEKQRLEFVAALENELRKSADSSFLTHDGIRSLITATELEHLLWVGNQEVLAKIDHHVERLRNDWNSDYPPENHFEQFSNDVTRLAASCAAWVDPNDIKQKLRRVIESASEDLYDRYDPPKENAKTALQKSENANTPLDDIFRDVDE